MKRKMLSLLVVLSCLGWGCAMAEKAPDMSEVNAALEKARKIAGGDKYLLITERNQCRDYGPDSMKPSGPSLGENAEPTKVFDNVYYVGGTIVGGWLITTSDGYILLDAMFGHSPEETIIPGMKKFGLDPAKIKYILITHPGPDHAGGAKYFQEKFGTRVIMGEKDWEGLLNPGPEAWHVRVEQLRKEGREKEIPPQESTWAGPPRMDLVGVDGQKLTLGDTTITMVLCPRKANGGGLSYIIPVFDNGEPHMWATFGNNGLPNTLEDKELYRKSVAHFLTYTDAAKVDVFISSHPFVDGSVERMKELQNRKPGEPNPFVIGQDAARRYLMILDQCAVVSMARSNAGLDGPGRGLQESRPKR